MSFGFGIGDFVAVTKLAHKLHKRFISAPSEFKNVSEEQVEIAHHLTLFTNYNHRLRRLEFLMQDAGIALSEAGVKGIEREKLRMLSDDCHRKLDDLDKCLESSKELESSHRDTKYNWKRFQQRFKWDPQEPRDLQSRIMDNVALQNLISNQWSLRVQAQTNEGVQYLVKQYTDKERRSVLHWLSPVQFDRQHDDDLHALQSETGQWMLEDERFVRWVGQRSQTLFCPGIEGAGKTSLTTIVSHYLSKAFGSDEGFALACVYCNFKRQTDHTPENILANILRQLVQTQVTEPEAVTRLYNKHKDQCTRPSIREISQAIQSVAGPFSPIFILVDALDELPEHLGSRDKLLDELFIIQESTRSNILATSRPIPNIEQRFTKDTILEIKACDDDVKRYIRRRLPRFPKFVQDDPALQTDIETEVIRGTQGMFLLAKLYLNSLAVKSTPNGIRTALRTFSESSDAYYDAYEDTLSRIKGQNAERAEMAMRVLMWLTCSRRPLMISELQVAVCIEEHDTEIDTGDIIAHEDLISLCGGLVSIGTGGVVHFIHRTVHEYLKCNQERWFPKADTIIASRCRTFLSFPVYNAGFIGLDEYRSEDKTHALFAYAATHWVSHARLSLPKDERVTSFINSDSKIPSSILFWSSKRRMHSLFWDQTDQDPAMSWPPTCGVEADVIWLIEQGIEVNISDTKWATPLHHAVLNSWTRCVSLLLDLKAEIKADVENMTPLHYAASGELQENEEMIQCFIDHDICIDLGVTRIPWRRTGPVNKEHYEPQIRGDEPPTLGHRTNGLTPLHYTALTGSCKVTEVLLSRGADPNAISPYFETPLHLTLRGDLYEQEEFDIRDGWNDTDARIEGCEDGFGYSSDDEAERAKVLNTIDKFRQRIFDLLLEYGSSPDATDFCGANALHHAARNNKVPDCMVQRLLSLMARGGVSCQDAEGQTALHLACSAGASGKVVLLLNHGADATLRDAYGRSSFHSAASWGDKETIRTMIAYTAAETITAQDHRGCNALHHFLNGPRGLFPDKEVVQLLLRCGVDPNQANKDGKAPLAFHGEQRRLLLGGIRTFDLGSRTDGP